ncbi:putative transcription factor MYC/MYB [Helianthus annuus]|uniref:Transcription factor MYC/MYB n=1 Tax=Helianthus annuus TaxID=4232 RepID=A0A251TL35_HELAN|nr:protein RICE SALT SENSITIVE 3 [Helianthus annuus]XP_035834551.1 protein RICE SALT SENSITIVE 3 [Helianthus annuus]KAF5787156.1 putative transcription factor MYC/MYB [Helianthus annuus]KAJ0522633.1 putative transcription factor MYC/MYB [Helianthus annuus]KAJ0880353.1 putative transcription factor MYC/MYB [Helianthus annuus]
MVGSGSTTDRNKEAVGMLALHETLRNICFNSEWTYSVFWTIRPRPRVRGGNGCKVGDDVGSLMLMWEDGFCRERMMDCVEDMDAGEDLVRKAFSKMSIQLYNYGEGLMGKVASDKCHKWVFKEPTECDQSISNYWQSSFDALPTEWNEQFDSGIQTIAVIQAGHGLLQLGSCKIVPEDLHFVLRMRHTFESLGYQSGFYLSQLFASTSSPSSSGIQLKQPTVPIHPSPAFNWAPLNRLPSQSFQNPARLGFQPKDETHMFLHPHSSEPHMGNIMGHDHAENDIKWPNGLTFFNALTEGLGGKPDGGQNANHEKHEGMYTDMENYLE